MIVYRKCRCFIAVPDNYIALLNATVYYAEISSETPMNTPVFRIRLSVERDDDEDPPLDIALTFNQNQMVQDLFEFENGDENSIDIFFPSEFDSVWKEMMMKIHH